MRRMTNLSSGRNEFKHGALSGQTPKSSLSPSVLKTRVSRVASR